jgi:hypothetical protein
MLFDSGLPKYGLETSRATQHARDANMYAKDLQNVLPAKGAQIERTRYRGFWCHDLTLIAFQFGGRVCVHVPGKPFGHRSEYIPWGFPDPFLGLSRLLGASIYSVKLDSGSEAQSQTVVT